MLAELICKEDEILLAGAAAPQIGVKREDALGFAGKVKAADLIAVCICPHAEVGAVILIDRVLRQRLRASLLGDRDLDIAPVDILERRACIAQRLDGGRKLLFRAGNIVQRLLRRGQRGGEGGKALFLIVLRLKHAAVRDRLAQRGNRRLVHHRDVQLAALLLAAPATREAQLYAAGLVDRGGDGGVHRIVGNGVRLENALIRGRDRDLERAAALALGAPDEAVAVVGEALPLAQQSAVACGRVLAVELEGRLHCALLLQRIDRAQELFGALRHLLCRGVVVFINVLCPLERRVKRLEGFLRILAALHA